MVGCTRLANGISRGISHKPALPQAQGGWQRIGQYACLPCTTSLEKKQDAAEFLHVSWHERRGKLREAGPGCHPRVAAEASHGASHARPRSIPEAPETEHGVTPEAPPNDTANVILDS